MGAAHIRDKTYRQPTTRDGNSVGVQSRYAPLVLVLPIALDGFRVRLPVRAGIIGISPAPFLLAVPADLVVLGIGVELMAVIFPTTLLLAIRPAANTLVGVIRGKLKDCLAETTTAIAH